MHWKLKAAIQNVISFLPDSASYSAYYWVQRHFGGLRNVTPVSGFLSGIETWKHILNCDGSPSNKVFFEVGTGRMAMAPLAYWLMGARQTITIDLNPYLKEDLIQECLRYLSANPDEVKAHFGNLVVEDRWQTLLDFARGQSFSLQEFLQNFSIDYRAPGDATKSDLPPRSVDFHTSYNVFEHIPGEILQEILAEGNRITSDSGMFVHRIDYSDHFSHSDNSISAINFLRYSDKQWDRFAGNRYMYMNRLRHDDYQQLFQQAGHEILAELPDLDSDVERILSDESIPLDERFAAKSSQVLAITGSWFVSRQQAGRDSVTQ